jgi:hypothetical protein
MHAASEGIVSIVATLFLSYGIGSNGHGQADVSGVTGKAIFETRPLPLPSSTPMLFSQQMIRAKVSRMGWTGRAPAPDDLQGLFWGF